MRFAFAGTPDFAARVLVRLADIGRSPCLVVSQPDRPKGRGRKASAPEAIIAARSLGLPYIQVEDINSPEAVSAFADSGASTVVVAAFGQILKPVVLDRFLCLNVHASLLPAYRGAAPIERAIAAGERTTGVSIMRMSEGLDEGPWALQNAVSVGPRDDAGSIGRVLAVLGAEGVDQTLTGLSDGTLTWTEQGEGANYAGKLSTFDTLLDPNRDSRTAHDQVRSLSPDIGARISTQGLSLKVWRTWPYGRAGLDPLPAMARSVEGSPGSLAAVDGRLFLGCAEGALELLAVQPAGKGKMATADFLRGYATRLGEKVDPWGAEPGS